RVAGVADRPGCPERHWLDDVAKLEAEALALAEDLLDPARLVVEAEDRLVDLRNLPEQVDLIVEKRSIEDRNDWFRRVHRERPQARALAAGEQNGLHVNHRSYTGGPRRTTGGWPLNLDARGIILTLWNGRRRSPSSRGHRCRSTCPTP